MAKNDGKIMNPQAWVDNGYNFETILKTQPQTPVDYYPTYMKVPGGYGRVLYVHNVEDGGNKNHWLRALSEEKNVILDIDLGVENTKDFIDRLDKAYVNHITKNGKNPSIKLSGQFENNDMTFGVLMKNIQEHQHKAVRVYIRVFVFARSKRDLEQRTKEIIGAHTRFKFAILRDYQFDEMRSHWVPALDQYAKLDEKQLGLSMSAFDFGGSFWANHTKLEDPYGSSIGITFTGGVVNFDLYLRDAKARSRPFALFVGQPDYGKSTLQKLLVEDAIKRGHRVVLFDPSKEYRLLTENAGGITYSLNGDGYMVNIMQIFATATYDDGSIDFINSFSQHIEKVSAIYGFMSQRLSPEQLSNDRIGLKNLLTEFYIEMKLWSTAPTKDKRLIADLFERAPEEFPTLSKFNIWLKLQKRALKDGKYSKDIPVSEDSIQRIIGTFSNMQLQNGAVFDGYTTLPDLAGEDLVRYDVSGLLKTPDVFNAQVYSALAMENDNIIKNGRKQRQLRREKKIELDEVKHTVLVLDEAQNYITMENAFNLNFIVSVMEQMRKNYAAVMMAMPTIKDLVVTDKTTNEIQGKQFIRDVTKMFDLMQYRFFFNLPFGDSESLQKVLGDTITPAELGQIPYLDRRQTLLNIQGDRNLLFTVKATEREVIRFDGGE